MIKKRWSDLSYCEEEGESIKDVQERNIRALKKILKNENSQNIIIGTHGTALSSILNYFNSNYGVNDFLRIINYMPYVIRLEFEDDRLIKMEEDFYIEKFYS
jgi:2,3-bisphosphoglycerate-dependent phosphoglycerate mutase